MNGTPGNTGNTSIGSAWNERMRLIRFRRKRESFRFWEEFKLVPRWLIWMMVVLYILAQIIALMVNLGIYKTTGEIFPPDLKGDPATASVALGLVVTGVSLVVAAVVFLLGYVNRDAKRRGMNATVWTLIVLILVPGYLVLGLIIYMLVREPLPYPCPKCGTTVGARFNFCPNCKCTLHPACPQCKQEVAETDRYCPYCACELAGQRTNDSVPSAAG
jgi:hypothetical protein